MRSKTFKGGLILIFALALGVSGCSQRPRPSVPPGTAGERASVPPPVASFDAAWQLIYDTHFDTNFNGVNWVGVRDELRPKAEAAKTTVQLRPIIQGMLERLGQSHMTLIPREAADALDQTRPAPKTRRSRRQRPAPATNNVVAAPGSTPSAEAARDGDTGMEVRLIDGKMLITRIQPGGAAAAGGLKPGWEIQEIDGRSVSQMTSQLGTDEPRKAKVIAWSLIAHALKGKPGSAIELQLADGKQPARKVTLVRRAEAGDPAKIGNMPTFFARFHQSRLPQPDGGQIGLIGFNVWMLPVAAQFDRAMTELRDCRGIIIDLRGNIGGLAAMTMGIAGHFLDEPVSLGTMKMRLGEIYFRANPRRVTPAGESVRPFSGPVALLTDDISLSASEIFAGGMKSLGRVRVFGLRTMGAALPAIFDRLPNGDLLMHAHGDFVTATGTRLEGTGVIPDVEISLTRQDLLAGHDAALQAAAAWISDAARTR